MINDTLFLIFLVGIILLCVINAFIISKYKTSKAQRNIIYVLLVVIFSLLMAYRPDIVPDTISYKQIFENINVDVSYGFNIFGEAERVEYGFLYLIKFYKLFSNNITLFFFLICCISVSLFLFGLNRIVFKLTQCKINIAAVLAFYISYFGIYYNGIAIRQGLAMALCVLSVAFFINKKYFQSLLFWFLAFLIHRLSFLLLFIAIVYKIFSYIRITHRGYYFIVCICLIIGVFGLGYKINGLMFELLSKILVGVGLDASYSMYIANGSNNYGFPIFLVYHTICGLILIYLVGKNSKYKNFINIYLIGIIIMNLLIGSEAISRGADYFIMFSLIIVSCLFTRNSGIYNQSRHTIQENTFGVSQIQSISKRNIVLIGIMILGYFLIVMNVIYPDLIELGI